jgi:hypothetical protein
MLGHHAVSEAPVSSLIAAILTGSQPVWLMGTTFQHFLLSETAAYVGGELPSLLDSQPAFSPTMVAFSASLAAMARGGDQALDAQPAIVVVHPTPTNAQPCFLSAEGGGGTQGCFLRSSPDLSITPNVVRQRYGPVQLVEITL